jgi:hypothetical protein
MHGPPGNGVTFAERKRLVRRGMMTRTRPWVPAPGCNAAILDWSLAGLPRVLEAPLQPRNDLIECALRLRLGLPTKMTPSLRGIC